MYESMLSFPELVKGGELDPLWIGDGNSFLYQSGTGAARRWFKIDAASGKQEPVFEGATDLSLVGTD